MTETQKRVGGYLAEIGRRGGRMSRRELSKSHARQMVAIRQAKRAALPAGVRWDELYGWTGTCLGREAGNRDWGSSKPWPRQDRKQVKLLKVS
jgi:hypothetical protein